MLQWRLLPFPVYEYVKWFCLLWLWAWIFKSIGTIDVLCTIIINIIMVYNWQGQPTRPVFNSVQQCPPLELCLPLSISTNQYRAWRYPKMPSSILITRVLAGLRDRSNFLWVINLHWLNQPSLVNRKYIPWHLNLFIPTSNSKFILTMFFLIAYLVSFKVKLN